MDDSFSVLGYHKTRRLRAANIYGTKVFPLSTGRKMWLGDGVYFWDTLENAEWWNQDKYTDGVILSAQLSCKTENYIDLDNPAHMRAIVDYAELIKEQVAADGSVDIDFQDKVQARAFFCTGYKKAYGIQLMRHSFPWLVDNSAGFRELHSRAQYCATDNSIISNIEHVTDTISGIKVGGNNEYI